MSEELVNSIEKLIEGNYGDYNRLTAILRAVKGGRSLYSSDQKYVDMLISNYLFPRESHIEEPRKKKTIDQKIQDTKQDYAGDQESEKNTPTNKCKNCGAVIVQSYQFCPKCGISKEKLKKSEVGHGGIRSYQILSLIGGILGMITVFLAGTVVQVLSIALNSFGTATPEKGELMSQVWISIFLYMISIIIPFVVKNTKAVGTLLIILSVATMISAGGFGIIGFIFLLTAGIVSLRWKKRTLMRLE